MNNNKKGFRNLKLTPDVVKEIDKIAEKLINESKPQLDELDRCLVISGVDLLIMINV